MTQGKAHEEGPIRQKVQNYLVLVVTSRTPLVLVSVITLRTEKPDRPEGAY